MVTNRSQTRTAVRRACALGALLIVVNAGCDSDTESDAAPDGTEVTSTTAAATITTITTAATTTTTEVATTTVPPTTTAPSTTTTGVATTTTLPPAVTVPPICPQAPPLAADAADATSVSADFDEDGLADLLRTYIVPSEGRWHVRVEFAAGGSDDVQIVDSNMVGAARPIGGHDVDGDGTNEAFITVGSGASAVLVGLYDVAACDLTRVTVGTEPAVFPIGATIGNSSGLACDGVGDLDRLFAQQVAADEYEGGFEPFTLSGSVLTPGPGDGASFTGDEAAALATLDCGTLALPS